MPGLSPQRCRRSGRSRSPWPWPCRWPWPRRPGSPAPRARTPRPSRSRRPRCPTWGPSSPPPRASPSTGSPRTHREPRSAPGRAPRSGRRCWRQRERTCRDPRGVKGLAVMKVGNGHLQVTFHKVPLYRFAGDKKKGQANGQNVGNVWFAVLKSGIPATTAAAGAAAAPTSTTAPAPATTQPTRRRHRASRRHRRRRPTRARDRTRPHPRRRRPRRPRRRRLHRARRHPPHRRRPPATSGMTGGGAAF